jgi:hypothetical protein
VGVKIWVGVPGSGPPLPPLPLPPPPPLPSPPPCLPSLLQSQQLGFLVGPWQGMAWDGMTGLLHAPHA